MIVIEDLEDVRAFVKEGKYQAACSSLEIMIREEKEDLRKKGKMV